MDLVRHTFTRLVSQLSETFELRLVLVIYTENSWVIAVRTYLQL
jgi:hypothetical protein